MDSFFCTAGMMENRVLIEVTNNSEHSFAFDGDWLRSGEWKTDRETVIEAHSVTVLELFSNGVHGVAGIFWYTDTANHDVYLSIAMANPRLQTTSFVAFAGLPPPNLKVELDNARKLTQDELCTSDGGCEWVAAKVGPATAIKLTIMPELHHFVPATAASMLAAKELAAKFPDTPEIVVASDAASVSSATVEATSAPETVPVVAHPVPESASETTETAFPQTAPAVPLSNSADEAGALPAQCPSSAEGAVSEKAQGCTTLAKSGDVPEDTGPTMEQWWAQTRPKDAADGLAQGVKTVGTSIVGSVGNVVACTISGAQQGGLGGLKGFGFGLATGAVILVGGTAFGVAQTVRGIVNTPDAIRSRREHRVWDQELGQWVDIDLCELEREVEAENSDLEEEVTTGPRDVAETEYYDLLKVKPSATGSEIKKAYHREARQCHPDKNPGDVEAKVKFQKLSDAYQVLSDPQTRKKYDKEGKEGFAEADLKMDPAVFFSLLFGSERFEPWIGELHLAMQTEEFAKAIEKESTAEEEQTMEQALKDADVNPAVLRRRQHRREVRCACHLRNKIDRFVNGRDLSGWEEQMHLEAVDLASAQFGPELLIALGEIYQLRAELYLADETVGRFTFSKRRLAAKHSGFTLSHRFVLYKNAASSLLRVKEVHDCAKNLKTVDGEDDDAQRQAVEAALDGALPTFLRTAWAAVVTDIDGTIKEVGRKLLKDKSESWQIRLRRAEALQRLGEIFVEEGLGAAEQQGEASARVMTSEAAKATLQEALLGSVREKK